MATLHILNFTRWLFLVLSLCRVLRASETKTFVFVTNYECTDNSTECAKRFVLEYGDLFKQEYTDYFDNDKLACEYSSPETRCEWIDIPSLVPCMTNFEILEQVNFLFGDSPVFGLFPVGGRSSQTCYTSSVLENLEYVEENYTSFEWRVQVLDPRACADFDDELWQRDEMCCSEVAECEVGSGVCQEDDDCDAIDFESTSESEASRVGYCAGAGSCRHFWNSDDWTSEDRCCLDVAQCAMVGASGWFPAESCCGENGVLCQEHEGGCANDAGCFGGLICGENNCAELWEPQLGEYSEEYNYRCCVDMKTDVVLSTNAMLPDISSPFTGSATYTIQLGSSTNTSHLSPPRSLFIEDFTQVNATMEATSWNIEAIYKDFDSWTLCATDDFDSPPPLICVDSITVSTGPSDPTVFTWDAASDRIDESDVKGQCVFLGSPDTLNGISRRTGYNRYESCITWNNEDDCSPDPCAEGATCMNDDPETGEYTCMCPDGWAGTHCYEDEDDCDPNPCVRGTCANGEPGTGEYACTCPDGWTGAHCNEDVDDCSESPCVYGSCANGEPGTGEYLCTCTDGWIGARCDEDGDDCNPNPCVRGACANGERGTGEYLCTCPDGWAGAHCDEDIFNECNLELCVHSTACIDLEGDSYSCQCEDGWTGINCDEGLERCPPLNRRNSLYRDERTCVGAVANDVCELECEADFFSWGDNTVTSANFVCQENGRWWPPSAEPLDCLPLCPEISELNPHSATVARCSSRLPGSECFLTCEPGYRVVEGTIDELVCSPSGVWTLGEAAASQAVVVNERNILECVVETCATTLEFSIELFDCSFQETTYEYTNEVAYGADKDMKVVDSNGETITTIPLMPGANTYTYDAADGTYNFTTFMEYPSTESHLEELNLLLNLSEVFTSATYTYRALLPQWMDKVSLNPVPADFSTMRVTLLVSATYSVDSDSDLELQLAGVEPSSGPFVFDLPKTRDQSLLVVRVTAQDGTHSDYRVQLARQLPSTCDEQRICESLDLSQCGDFCASEVSIDIDWPVLATIGGTILLLWASTATLLSRAFPNYSFTSSKTLIFFTSVFDTVTDVIFLLALFSTNFTMLQYAALALVSTTFVGNVAAMVFVIHKERRDNHLFAEWLRQHYTAAGVFACFSLNNCESLLLLCVGCDVNHGSAIDLSSHRQVGGKTKSRSAIVRQLFSAPLSPWAVRKLQLTSWLGLALDDIGLFAVQMAIYLLDTGVLQLGNTLFVFLAINALILLMRVVVFCFRTCAVRSRDARKEAAAVVAAQLRAEMNDATVRNDVETCKELAKLLECVEAGELPDAQISDALKKLEQMVKAAALDHDFERCIELTRHLDTLRVIAPVSLLDAGSQKGETPTVPSSAPLPVRRGEVELARVAPASRSHTPSLPPSPCTPSAQKSSVGPTRRGPFQLPLPAQSPPRRHSGPTPVASPAAVPLPPRPRHHGVSLSTGGSPSVPPSPRKSPVAPPKPPTTGLRVPLRSPPRRHSGPTPQSVTTTQQQQPPHRRSQGDGDQPAAAPEVGTLLHQHLVRAFDLAKEESDANANHTADADGREGFVVRTGAPSRTQR